MWAVRGALLTYVCSTRLLRALLSVFPTTRTVELYRPAIAIFPLWGIHFFSRHATAVLAIVVDVLAGFWARSSWNIRHLSLEVLDWSIPIVGSLDLLQCMGSCDLPMMVPFVNASNAPRSNIVFCNMTTEEGEVRKETQMLPFYSRRPHT